MKLKKINILYVYLHNYFAKIVWRLKKLPYLCTGIQKQFGIQREKMADKI